MVASYHIWFNRVSGGVDVFLLISAFLLSLSFIRKVEQGRGLDLLHYWVHVFKRLLPAVAVVIVGTLVASAIFVPRSRWNEILSQAWSSLLYFQNWALAANSVDYYAADDSIASPFQHFWSLSVQGQVFILWPLLFALAALIARVAKRRFRAVVLVVFGTVFVVSLAFSISETYTNQAHAYFDTRTRLWEFAFGTLLALSLPYLRLPRGLRIIAGWAGLAAILSGGFILDVQGQFPGFVALWPLVAAALVILAGQTGSRWGADRLLSWGPLVRMGDMSYALYLWHWPVMVIYLVYRGYPSAGPLSGAAIILASLMLAYLTTRFVERPLRRAAWFDVNLKRSVLVVAVCLSLVAVPLAGVQYGLKAQAEKLQAEAEKNYPGARVLMPGYIASEAAETAPIQSVSSQDPDTWGRLALECADVEDGPTDPALVGRCFSTDNAGEAEKTILVVGSSHVQQWLSAIEPMAEANNYRVIALLLGLCPYGEEDDTRNADCNAFNAAATDFALEIKPDAFVTLATVSRTDEANDPVVDGLPGAAQKLQAEGIPVVGIRDNPRFAFDMQLCAESNGEEAEECTEPLATKLSPVWPWNGMGVDTPLLDFSDLICPEGICRPVIGNTYVYVDNNHLTTSYTASMASEFDRRFHEAVGW